MGLVGGGGGGGGPIKEVKREPRQGLTLVPLQLVVSAFCGTGGAFMGGLGGV